MRGILAGIVETGDVIGTVGPGQAILAVTFDNWMIDELAALGTDLEALEPEPIESDDAQRRFILLVIRPPATPPGGDAQEKDQRRWATKQLRDRLGARATPCSSERRTRS